MMERRTKMLVRTFGFALVGAASDARTGGRAHHQTSVGLSEVDAC